MQLAFSVYNSLPLDYAAILFLYASSASSCQNRVYSELTSLVKYDLEKKRETKGENSTKKQVHLAVSAVLQTVPCLKQHVCATVFDNKCISNL